MLQFALEDRPGPRLLLASISAGSSPDASTSPRGSTATKGSGGGLRLPRLPDASRLPEGLRASVKRLARGPGGGKGGGGAQGLRSHRLPPPPDLRQLHQVAVAAGGVLVAAISQAAQRMAAVRPGRSSQTLPFYQSFKLPWNVGARSGSRRASREAASLAKALAARGHEYERSLDVRAAVQCFEEASKLVPECASYLSMAAKCWSDLTFYYDVRTDRERQLVNLKAIEYAEKCIEASPREVVGHVAMCISKGRLALYTDNKTKVRLAKEAQLCAYSAIECDPNDDVAHHLMGRWHYEMAQINVVLRTLVRIMYGTALSPGTRQDALASFKRAAELAPQRLIHRVEAGRVHLELGQVAEGVAELETALQLEVEDINAWHTRMDAEKLLAQVRRQPWKQPSLVPPHAQAAEQRAAAAAAAGGTAPAASISTAALLSGARQQEIVDEALRAASAAVSPPPAAAA